MELNGCELTELPPLISKLTNLEVLLLENNNLTNLPCEFSTLQQLQVLSLDKNSLTFVPSSIYKLTSLKHLELCNNKLTQVTAELSSLTNLTELVIGNNALTTLPKSLYNLTQLRCLYLGFNKFVHFPTELLSLTSLSLLGCNGSLFHTFPTEIQYLRQLTRIVCYNTLLIYIPISLLRNSNFTLQFDDFFHSLKFPPKKEYLDNKEWQTVYDDIYNNCDREDSDAVVDDNRESKVCSLFSQIFLIFVLLKINSHSSLMMTFYYFIDPLQLGSEVFVVDSIEASFLTPPDSFHEIVKEKEMSQMLLNGKRLVDWMRTMTMLQEKDYEMLVLVKRGPQFEMF